MADNKHEHMFSSKSQWAWAFATKQPWARKWAHRNQTAHPYKTLPGNKAGGSTMRTRMNKVRTALTGR